MNHLTDAPQPSMNGTAEVSSLETQITTTTPDNAGLLDVPETAENSEMLDLDALLAATFEDLTQAETTEREVGELLGQRDALMSRAEITRTLGTTRPAQVEAATTKIDGVTPQSYQRLIRLKYTDPSMAARMEQAQIALTRIEQLPSRTLTLQMEQQREIIAAAQLHFNSEMDAKIVGGQVETAIRRDRARLTAQTLYTTRLHELEAQISVIEEDPRVQERLAIADAAIMAAQVEAERVEAERVALENRTTIESYSRGLHSVTSRQRTAVERISRALDNDRIGESLVHYATNGDDQARARFFTSLRNQIIDQIIVGDGLNLSRPSDIAPFNIVGKGIDYNNAIKGLEQAPLIVQQQAQCQQAFELDRALRALVGRQSYYNATTKQNVLSPIYQAFETRRLNDQSGETARLQQEIRDQAAAELARAEAEILRAEREAAERQAARERFIAAGGFPVQVPIYSSEEVDGKKQRVLSGYRDGAVRLHRQGDTFIVAEVRGYVGKLKAGDNSPLNMANFPDYVRQAAPNYFAMQGDNYVERVIYTAEQTE